MESIHFTDDIGQEFSLAKYFHAGHPVLLAPVFYGCKGICAVTLENLVSSLKLVAPSPGHGFELLVVSIDPEDSTDIARERKAFYLEKYGRLETASGWHFLTGKSGEIQKLADALGFQFERDSSGLISHASALYVLSSNGVITATLPGPTLSHKEIRAALFEAEEGKVEIFVQRLSALCYSYMPHPGVLNSPLRWLVALLFGCGAMGATILRRKKNKTKAATAMVL